MTAGLITPRPTSRRGLIRTRRCAAKEYGVRREGIINGSRPPSQDVRVSLTAHPEDVAHLRRLHR